LIEPSSCVDARAGPISAPECPGALRPYYRHSLAVRAFHWINAASVLLLLMSGLQIFNTYPRLHLGYTAYHTTPSIFEIGGNRNPEHPESWMRIGNVRIDTTGLLGPVEETLVYGATNVAFPGWMTLPSGPMDLGGGRAWHMLMLWVFFINGAVFLVYGFVSGHFRRRYLPRLEQLRARAILLDVVFHLRLRRATGGRALDYNLLQRLAYSLIVFVVMPAIVLTGMTMSPSALAAFPWLQPLFHGRQTARTLHFLLAVSLVLFVVVHLVQVFVAGFANEIRAITTGYFVVRSDRRN